CCGFLLYQRMPQTMRSKLFLDKQLPAPRRLAGRAILPLPFRVHGMHEMQRKNERGEPDTKALLNEVNHLRSRRQTAKVKRAIFKLLERGARLGDPYFIWSLGEAIEHGEGCLPSIELAVRRYLVAARHGQPEAMTALGVYYFQQSRRPNY